MIEFHLRYPVMSVRSTVINNSQCGISTGLVLVTAFQPDSLGQLLSDYFTSLDQLASCGHVSNTFGLILQITGHLGLAKLD